MFLTLLTLPQRELFVQATQLLIESDSLSHEEELELFDAIRLECDFDSTPEPKDRDTLLAELMTAFDEPTQRNVFLLELAGVLVVDSAETPEESALYEEVGRRLGIADYAEEYLEFARDARALTLRGRDLITTD